jgi:hypothetical protein
VKIVQLQHPENTYPDVVEAVCIKLGKDYRFHSSIFMPSPIQGTGILMMFFEPKVRLKILEFKAKKDEES